jgi:hypothetical protein
MLDTNHNIDEKLIALCEYAPTAMTSLSYRSVKGVPVPENGVFVVSALGVEAVPKATGGVAGICETCKAG